MQEQPKKTHLKLIKLSDKKEEAPLPKEKEPKVARSLLNFLNQFAEDLEKEVELIKKF